MKRKPVWKLGAPLGLQIIVVLVGTASYAGHNRDCGDSDGEE